mmetsp:Transcript_62561/g.183448  ORF Transcript_62561/g.183448 Transcript_62561/m.183448 type:complete len:117 (+) Transcript_62561:95-445(+)
MMWPTFGPSGVCGPCHATDCQLDVVKVKHLDSDALEMSDSISREVIPVSSSPSRRDRPSRCEPPTPNETPRSARCGEATAEQCFGEVRAVDLKSKYASCWRAEAATASKEAHQGSP